MHKAIILCILMTGFHLGNFTSDEQYLKQFTNLHRKDFEKFLNPLLIERRVGTYGHKQAQKHIINHLRSSGWIVDLESHTENTIIGVKTFTNIRAKLPNPLNKTTNDIFLACHYETKSTSFKFIGATDAAVPCAMLLSVASKLNESLINSVQLQTNKLTSIQLLFFDGEEAFRTWTEEDSLYGSRHMAKLMSLRQIGNDRKEIDTMQLMILLDLIGSSDTYFTNMYPSQSGYHYELMRNIEMILSNARSNNDKYPSRPMFTDRQCGPVADDNIPFQQKGVPVLHLISCPFPKVWHTESDNENALDHRRIQFFMDILTIYLAKIYELKIIQTIT